MIESSPQITLAMAAMIGVVFFTIGFIIGQTYLRQEKQFTKLQQDLLASNLDQLIDARARLKRIREGRG